MPSTTYNGMFGNRTKAVVISSCEGTVGDESTAGSPCVRWRTVQHSSRRYKTVVITRIRGCVKEKIGFVG